MTAVATISLITGGNSVVFEGDVELKGIPQTEAACSAFTAAGIARRCAEQIQETVKHANGGTGLFNAGKIIDARWVWCPPAAGSPADAHDGDAILSIITLTETDGVRSYLALLI